LGTSRYAPRGRADPNPHFVRPEPDRRIGSHTSASRVWVQLASGPDESALGAQFARIAARKPDLFIGIRPFVSTVGERTKLLIGPFKDRENSEIFIDELADAQIAGFSWVSPAGQPVRKLVAP
jgi:hypothetical protein